MIDFRFAKVGKILALDLLYAGKVVASELVDPDNEKLMQMTLPELAEYIVSLRLENALDEGDTENGTLLANALYSLRKEKVN